MMIFKNNILKKFFIYFLLILLFITVSVSLMIGSYTVSFVDTLSIVINKLFSFTLSNYSDTYEVIVWDIRAPRILMAVFTGIALSIAGVIYQSIFRNPIVEPYILGVSSGAAFGASLGIIYPFFSVGVKLFAFMFAMFSLIISYSLAYRRDRTPIVSLVLSGIIIGSIFTALVSILKYLSDDTQLREIVFWMMGGMYYSSWNDVFVNGVAVGAVFLLIWILSWKLNILSMGDDTARSLGVHPELYKAIFITSATFITAMIVSTVGIIAWVGLMVPHMARMLVGADNRYLIPTASLLGAVYIVICDTLARMVIESEIPIGIITSIIGAPFLLWLLRSRSEKVY